MSIIKCGTKDHILTVQVIFSLIMSFTFAHFNIANLPCLAALDVVETHYKGPFVLQMRNATISIIKYACDIISSENDYILCKDYFHV